MDESHPAPIEVTSADLGKLLNCVDAAAKLYAKVEVDAWRLPPATQRSIKGLDAALKELGVPGAS